MSSAPVADSRRLEQTREIGPARWSDCLAVASEQLPDRRQLVIGVLPGEGIGPEVIACALEVLEAVTSATGLQATVRYGGPVGRDAERTHNTPLPAEVTAFCDAVFADRGAILSGPGGSRFVYDLRRQFDLFFKISPLQVANGLPDASPLKPQLLQDVDILVTRENCGGIYQGRWNERTQGDDRSAEHLAVYSRSQVMRFLNASARLARSRGGRMTVVWKEAGLPTISRLWRDCAGEAAENVGVQLAIVDIDLMAYRLVHDAPAFDVIAAPNLFGDVLGDLGAVLLGSRGNSYSGNFSGDGRAVYQTNHGAAYDLAGLNRANPVGQVLSLAMMLRESFGLPREAAAVEAAIRSVWSAGIRTADVAAPGARIVTTSTMGERIATEVKRLLQSTSGGHSATT
jgi:3-isopropylmalate dehydrogenase